MGENPEGGKVRLKGGELRSRIVPAAVVDEQDLDVASMEGGSDLPRQLRGRPGLVEDGHNHGNLRSARRRRGCGQARLEGGIHIRLYDLSRLKGNDAAAGSC
jgi:hypothetical protein